MAASPRPPHGSWSRPAPIRRAAARPPVQPISLRPGTRLVREWRGVTHMVLIHADGIEWRGQRYRSLTIVARKITGARWSGPRFFGLRQRLAGLYFNRENRPWPGLITREPGPPSAARSTPANRPTRGSSRNSILSTPGGRRARPIS
jgi:hypothetical protein